MDKRQLACTYEVLMQEDEGPNASWLCQVDRQTLQRAGAMMAGQALSFRRSGSVTPVRVRAKP